jgi:hypothetical protein
MSTKPKHTLVIDRRKCPVKLADAFVCGGVKNAFIYKAKITTRGLTPEGFVTEVKALIDDIDYAFDRGEIRYVGGTEPAAGQVLKASCEELAQGVLNVIAHRVLLLESAEVVVENLTGEVQLEWQAGEYVPRFPRLATGAEKGETAKRPQSRSSC